NPGDPHMTAADTRTGPRPWCFSTLRFRGFAATVLLSALAAHPVVADEGEIGKLLKEKGVTVTEAKGVVTAVTVNDGPKLTDADFKQIGRLVHLKTLNLNNCLNDERLTQLMGLVELEYMQTNLAQVTDDGLKSLARLKNLRNVKFFHPGKSFSGAGL